MAHRKMSKEFREQYERAAYIVYSAIGSDMEAVESMESMSKRTFAEVIRDANRIGSVVTRGMWSHPDEFTAEFKQFIKDHEYDPEYRRDMNNAASAVQ